MPRSPRLHAPDLIYHVFARGNNREPIFFDYSNYERFIANLERYRPSHEYKLFAYCLLPNHFHLLLQVGNINLSKIMQILMTAYTMYINKKYSRIGHIFQGRFQSIIVEKETYLLQVLRYIHLNPVKAGLIDKPEAYAWSSYKYYYNNYANEVVKLATQEILEMITPNLAKQRTLFREFTNAGLEEKFDPIKKQVRGILGSSKFVQKLTRVLKGVRP